MTISYLAAFLGGFISLISPCSAMIIPTFAAAASKKTNSFFITASVFSIGLLVALLPVDFGFTFIGRIMLVHRRSITLAIGVLLLIWGVLTLLGRHLPFPSLSGWL